MSQRHRVGLQHSDRSCPTERVVDEDAMFSFRFRIERASHVMPELRPIVLAEDNANDGEEVLDYLYQRNTNVGWPAKHPALILLDLKMPKVDGIEVLRTIKGDPVL